MLSDRHAAQLLAKAGYKGSGGLGPDESGITSPIPAWHNQGRMGIGSAPNQSRAKSQLAPTAGRLSMKEVRHGPQESVEVGSSRETSTQQPRKRSSMPGENWKDRLREEEPPVLFPFQRCAHDATMQCSCCLVACIPVLCSLHPARLVAKACGGSTEAAPQKKSKSYVDVMLNEQGWIALHEATDALSEGQWMGAGHGKAEETGEESGRRGSSKQGIG